MTRLPPVKIEIDPATLTPETKCGYCTRSICCTYVTQHIETPRSMDDFDTLLWQVSHENTEVYKDEEGWFLLANNPCTHLMPDGRCGIYEKRPLICREHDNEDCEFNAQAGEEDFELYFPSYESLDRYCRKRFKHWDQRFKKWEKSR